MFYDHDHVDGVKISFTSKTTSEIRAGIDRWIEVFTYRTHESKMTVVGFVDEFKNVYDYGNHFNSIAQIV